ncbi:MAG: L,D-transpeptidase family protein, partial [Chthoniobacterales bacterium]|nr:L,D-transpeptidase family protein [Chthoniobacterales bacterium]
MHRSPNSKLFLALLQLAFLNFALNACSYSTKSSDFFTTYYLGPDGTILAMPTATYRATKKHSKLNTSQSPPVESWWHDDPHLGPPSITINLTEQRAYFKRGNKTVGLTSISSGREGYSTPTGNFKIIQKSRNHVSNLYGDFVDSQGNIVMENVAVHRDPCPPGARFRGAPMPYFLRIHGAIGMHAGYLPGYPASHGCIRLPMEMAKLFFENSHI